MRSSFRKGMRIHRRKGNQDHHSHLFLFIQIWFCCFCPWYLILHIWFCFFHTFISLGNIRFQKYCTFAFYFAFCVVGVNFGFDRIWNQISNLVVWERNQVFSRFVFISIAFWIWFGFFPCIMYLFSAFVFGISFLFLFYFLFDF